MPVPKIPLGLLPSPTPGLARLSLARVEAENAFLCNLLWWASGVVFFLALNLLTTGLTPPWSLFPIAGWGLAIAIQGAGVVAGRVRYVEDHRRLARGAVATAAPGGEGPEAGVGSTEHLRQELLRAGEAARRALGPVSPEVIADLARGEAQALAILAWLDEAEGLLPRLREERDLRREVAAALSRPGENELRGTRRRLLDELDRRDLKLARLEREVERRRALLESFFLAVESASLPGASEAVLAAVREPLRERASSLEAAVVPGAPPAAAAPPAAPDRIREEVRLARDLQQSILPREAPEIPGLTVAHLYRPSSEVGGDFYDFHATGPGRLLVAIGDASGHGLDSSMVSSMVKSALYTLIAAGRGLAETMAELNRMMCHTLGRRRLMTLALLEIDTGRRTIAWVNAGQVFPLLVRGAEVRELEQPGYPLGVRPGTGYTVVEEPWRPGDLLLLLTDGYVEAADRRGEALGWKRLGERLAELAGADVGTIVAELAEGLSRHLDGEPPKDDVTLVAIGLEPVRAGTRGKTAHEGSARGATAPDRGGEEAERR